MSAGTGPAVAAAGALPDAGTEAESRLLAHARLAGAEELLTARGRAALLGPGAVPARVRVKPGASVLLAHRAGAEGAPAPAELGWTLLVASDDKRDGVLRRAARHGAAVREQARAEGAPALLTGGLDADPRLGRELHRVLDALDGAARVLAYNPARHALVADPARGRVLRVAARPLTALGELTRRWAGAGVPTLAHHPWRDRPAVLVADRWGAGDLTEHAADPAAEALARALGGVLARLHRADPADLLGRPRGEVPAARAGAAADGPVDLLAALLPDRAERTRALADRLAERRAAEAVPTRRVLIHGDLSPDQVLVDPARAAAPGSAEDAARALRLVDLDRAGLGPAEADLGSWAAACLREDREHLLEPFLAGYAAAAPLPAPHRLATWTARALLAAAPDPMRRLRPDWPARVEHALDLAERLLDDPTRLPAPTSRPAPPRTGLDRAARRAEPEGEGQDRGAASTPPSVDDPASAGPPAPVEVPAQVDLADGRWEVRRAWPDDGRGLPLELRRRGVLRGARLSADGTLAVPPPGEDPRLPALARLLRDRPDGRVVSHRPGKRAVVHLPAGPDGEEAAYVKVVRPDRAPRMLAALAGSAAFAEHFRTPAVLAAGADTVRWAALEGTPLHEPPAPDAADAADWSAAWSRALAAWAATVTATREGRGVTGRPHDATAEARVLEQWHARSACVHPAGAASRERAVLAALAELGDLPPAARPALIHRDLHDQQVLRGGPGTPGLLDRDTATWGDPAVDLGNLRAHARWRGVQGWWRTEQAAVVRDAVDVAAEQVGVEAARVAVLERATLARLQCVYAFRPRWRDALAALADGADGR